MTSRKKKKAYRVLKEFTLSEVSLVDTPAQGHARVTICKRADSETLIAKGKRAITTAQDGHAHAVTLSGFGGDEMKSGSTSWVDGHTHDWVMDEAGNLIIADAEGHTHGIAVLVKNNSEGSDSTAPEDHTVETTPAEPIGKNTDPEKMSDQTKTAPAEGTVSKAEHDALQKRADRFEQIAGLSPAQREHFDSLTGDAADDFLAKSAEARDTVLKNLRDADPVVYTTRTGIELRKSNGDVAIQLAKENDDLAKGLAIAAEERIQKRADNLFKNLKGEAPEKAALLKAVEGIADEGLRGKVTEMLKAHDAGLGAAFKRAGTSTSDDDQDDVTKSAGDRLDDLVKRYVADNDGVDENVAYAAVLDTEEGAKLYAEHTGR